MNFVTINSFDVLWQIPNLSEVSNTFDDFSERQCEEALVDLIGYDAYADFIAGVEAEDATYLEMRDGGDYIYQGKTYKWAGMEEMLAPYVYAAWIRRTTVNFTGVNSIVPNAENAVAVLPIHQIVDAENAFVKLAGVDYNQKNTLYGWLKANSIEVDWGCPELQNLFGI